jgi:hypothetical protein
MRADELRQDTKDTLIHRASGNPPPTIDIKQTQERRMEIEGGNPHCSHWTEHPCGFDGFSAQSNRF